METSRLRLSITNVVKDAEQGLPLYTASFALFRNSEQLTLTIGYYSVAKMLFDTDTSFLSDKTSSVSPALPLVLFPGSLS